MSITRIVSYIAQLDDPQQGLYKRNDHEKWELLRTFVHTLAQQAQSSAPEPELPEAVAYTYQNRYTDQHYLTWRKSDGGKNWNPLFGATQMQAHYQAGVAAGRAMEWQPIETAPKDGTKVLAVLNRRIMDAFATPRNDGPAIWTFGMWSGEHIQPTHWMPLPAAPKEQQ